MNGFLLNKILSILVKLVPTNEEEKKNDLPIFIQLRFMWHMFNLWKVFDRHRITPIIRGLIKKYRDGFYGNGAKVCRTKPIGAD